MVVWNRLPKSWKLGEKWRNCTVECDEITSRHTKHANQCKTDFRNLPDMLNPVHQAVVRHVAKVWKRLLLWLWPRIFRRSICHFADFRRPRPSKDVRLTFKTHDFMFEKKKSIARQGIDTIEPLFPTAIIHSYFILPIPITHSELVWYLVDRNAKW